MLKNNTICFLTELLVEQWKLYPGQSSSLPRLVTKTHPVFTGKESPLAQKEMRRQLGSHTHPRANWSQRIEKSPKGSPLPKWSSLTFRSASFFFYPFKVHSVWLWSGCCYFREEKVGCCGVRKGSDRKLPFLWLSFVREKDAWDSWDTPGCKQAWESIARMVGERQLHPKGSKTGS